MISRVPLRTRMHRLVALLATAGMGACGGQDIEEARTAVIVDAEGAQLTGAMLEQYLLKIPEQTSRVAADMVVSAWIDVALLQHAARNNIDLQDSAVVDLALRPDAVRGQLQGFALERLQQRVEPTDAEADSLYNLGNVRAYQQLFFTLQRGDTAVTNQPNRERARFMQLLRDRAMQGESFTAMVREHSEDTIYKAVDGFMPASERKDLPNFIAGAVWDLAPGALSRPLASPRGLHVLRRATMEESRSRMKTWLKPRLAERENQVYIDSMSSAYQVAVAEGAVERMRTMSADPMKESGGDAPLATWRGGALTPDVARLWLAVVPPRERVQFTNAADTTISNWLMQVARFEVIATQVGGGTIPSAEGRAALAPQFRQSVDAVTKAWAMLGDGKTPTAAAAAVLDTLSSGSVPYRPPPGALSAILRDRFNVTVNSDAIDVIVDETLLEQARRRAADTTAAPAPGDTTRRP